MRDLLAQGIVGGIAGTIVFLPQICLLFFLITLLEDTGYLARAAFVMDRLLARFGLPGHAFVPLLTSHACALPGIMSTRLIPDRRDRLATILVAPFMSCSARLPVYVLLTTLLFAGRPAAAGVAFAGCYLLGAGAALVTAKLFGSTILEGPCAPDDPRAAVLQDAVLRNALLTARDQGLAFLTTAGTVIVAICVVMWWLSAYPHVDPPARAVELRSAADAARRDASAGRRPSTPRPTRLRRARRRPAALPGASATRWSRPSRRWASTGSSRWACSRASSRARSSSPPCRCWRRGRRTPRWTRGWCTRIRSMTRDDGTPVFTPSTAASALVFFVLAMQCLPTLTVTRKETGSVRYAALQLGYMSGLAYVAAFLLHQGLRAAGVA